MKIQKLGSSSLTSARLSYGCMRVSGSWTPSEVTPEMEARGRAAIRAAFDAGYTLFDHADIYGRGTCEKVFGDVLRESPNLRKQCVIATKCGIRFDGDPNPNSPHRYDFSAEHILKSCDGSLKRLGIETIDVYQLHRPDPLCDPHEVAGAFEKLKSAGKVREFGVSNFTPSQMTMLRKYCPMPLIVNQVEIHLGNLSCLTDGTLDQCIELNITPLAWSPLGGGFLGAGGNVSENNPRRELLEKLQATLDEIAGTHNVSRTVIALAWLLKHPSKIIPIVGSINPDHIRDAARADAVELSREEWYRLLVAARGRRMP